METKKITIYSTPACVYCQMAKKFLKEHKIEYAEFDVAADAEKRDEMLQKSGQMGVPVIKIGDEIIVGFDKKRISQLLGIK